MSGLESLPFGQIANGGPRGRHDDLIMKQKITLNQALCGFSMAITHPDGRTILIKNPAGKITEPGQLYQISGEGEQVKGSKDPGNLYVVFEITFPESNFSTEDGYKKLERLLGARPAENLPITGDKVKEVPLGEYRQQGRNASHYFDDKDEEEEPGVQRVQCASG